MCWRTGRLIVQVIDHLHDWHRARATLTGRVGVVLTMGALHAGHMSLVEAARRENDGVIATIFVNPAQFAANEDFTRYPRTLNQDLAMLEAAGVDLVFTPTHEMMYPAGYQTWIDVTEVTQGLEGERRPGHFRGVATVVTKLFNLTRPDRSYFGQKDAQQVAVIKGLVRDLNLPMTIRVCPTAREVDGLAMSSRNRYLTPAERQAAPIIHRALQAAAKRYEMGERQPEHLKEAALQIIAGETLASVDYVSLNDAHSLRPALEITDEPLLLSMTVRFGATHLLDNMLLPAHLNNLADLTRLLGGDGTFNGNSSA